MVRNFTMKQYKHVCTPLIVALSSSLLFCNSMALEKPIEWNISAPDVVLDQTRNPINGDFTITSGNLILDNSSSSSTGNVLKGNVTFIHNYGSGFDATNTYVGLSSGNFSASATEGRNSALGYSALRYISSGTDDTAIGYAASQNNTTGIGNTSIGSLAGSSNQSGSYITSVGYGALYNNTNWYNTAIGAYAGTSVVIGTGNLLAGYAAGYSVTGSNNVCIGKGAAYTGTALTSGINNIIIGTDANAGAANRNRGILLQTGSATGLTADRQIRIGFGGESSTTCFVDGISGVGVSGASVLVSSSGQLGVAVSSQRYKENIQPLTNIGDSFMRLNPVSFNYTFDNARNVNYGLVAEEVAEVFPNLVVHNEKGEVEAIQHHQFDAVLVKMVQELKREVAELKQQIVELSSRR
jgi:hypothetical protein